MAHALREFIRKQMDERTIDQATLTRTSGLSRSHVSKLLKDDRERLPQLPRRETLAGIAKAFNVSDQVVLAVAVEALGLGYSSQDFVYGLVDATDDELVSEMARRMRNRSAHGPVRDSGRLTDFVVPHPDSDHVTTIEVKGVGGVGTSTSVPNLIRLYKTLRDGAARRGEVDYVFVAGLLLEVAESSPASLVDALSPDELAELRAIVAGSRRAETEEEVAREEARAAIEGLRPPASVEVDVSTDKQA